MGDRRSGEGGRGEGRDEADAPGEGRDGGREGDRESRVERSRRAPRVQNCRNLFRMRFPTTFGTAVDRAPSAGVYPTPFRRDGREGIQALERGDAVREDAVHVHVVPILVRDAHPGPRPPVVPILIRDAHPGPRAPRAPRRAPDRDSRLPRTHRVASRGRPQPPPPRRRRERRAELRARARAISSPRGPPGDVRGRFRLRHGAAPQRSHRRARRLPVQVRPRPRAILRRGSALPRGVRRRPLRAPHVQDHLHGEHEVHSGRLRGPGEQPMVSRARAVHRAAQSAKAGEVSASAQQSGGRKVAKRHFTCASRRRRTANDSPGMRTGR